MSENKKNKHLTYEDRTNIESGLNNNKSLKEIATIIDKNVSTIEKEIKKNKCIRYPSHWNNSGNHCKNKLKCKKFDCNNSKECYQEYRCGKLTKLTSVCNGCERKSKCRETRMLYYAKIAHSDYREKLSNSREGINITKSEICEIDNIIIPLIKEKNHTINQVYINNPDILNFSKPTMYKYINSNVFDLQNIDLKRKVKYKKRKVHNKQRKETIIRKGRVYNDFKEFIQDNNESSIVEMDTVEGKKGESVLLTLMFRKSKLMLIYLLESKTKNEVCKVFAELKSKFTNEEFKELFRVILTDNGSEFFAPEFIENNSNGEKDIDVFFCDPCASWQKGMIEKNHEYIRDILPKGTSFKELTQEKVNLIMNNINSVPRESLNNKTPYEMSEFVKYDDILKDKLGLIKISPNSVDMSPNLIKGI